tara:strand:+ start:1227 stop:1535 length:309 start_codon:yes stop_codon:yes gene_type:complete
MRKLIEYQAYFEDLRRDNLEMNNLHVSMDCAVLHSELTNAIILLNSIGISDLDKAAYYINTQMLVHLENFEKELASEFFEQAKVLCKARAILKEWIERCEVG